MKTLFGGSDSKDTNSASSGYGSLPPALRAKFDEIANTGGQLLDNPSQYFAPMGLTSEEEMARGMLDPANMQAGISEYLNPFRDMITQDINKSFEGGFGALNSRASEAGAFGSSKFREGEADLERSRLDSIASAQGNQYNQAYNQYQQGIGNLLGFGGLERGVDMGQRMALPSALSSYSSLLNPLLGGSTSTGYGMTNQRRGATQGFNDVFGGSQ